ncbi:hypothetical protein [Rhodococcus sp. IEGM 1307]|nr:hypothetical protein [Rhodococcus sp. IEGM 1307]MDI9979337.1 hypothetical protein [Rhodococcus sp. IEGM 1307]
MAPQNGGVEEAADGLGMTRQGVLKAIKGKVLPAHSCGWYVGAAAVGGR